MPRCGYAGAVGDAGPRDRRRPRPHAAGRDRTQPVETALVGEVAPGDWLLVFLDSARERIDAARAAEVDATLDLLEQALGGGHADAAAGFVLPSAMDATQLAALTGGASHPADRADGADTR
ncbi:HypC/HybG/HupF family hydrogenase formation chaperone [Rubrivivax gelatinosus]|uniref:HypC/HybG/HupF family hydrogenase formation chaperone n=1 Tax=Rubrivivax gelatinosus TaxID=28068 RepID=UPI0002FB2BC2|nr:HypC/HybG/HupF family hydrogenase formation chaperone [Rubrivivax gelatinosus]